MHQPQIKKKKAFTLVELIIVITILTILSSIAFISFQNYTKDTRDSVRLVDIKQIYNGLDIERIKTEKTPLPEKYIEVTDGTKILTYQGYVGERILRQIKINNGGQDPLTKGYYTYTTDPQNKKIQLMTYLETSNKEVKILGKLEELIKQANATTNSGYYQDKHIYIYGDKIGILTDKNKVPLQETTTNTGIDLTTNTQELTTYFGGEIYDGGTSTKTGTTLINQIEGVQNGTVPCNETEYNGYTITSQQDQETQTYTKTLTGIENGTGTGEIEATCNNGILNYTEKPNTLNCTVGYVPNTNGTNCVENKCSGTFPDNAEENGTQELGGTWNYSESTGICKFKCQEGYTYDLGNNKCNINKYTISGTITNGDGGTISLCGTSTNIDSSGNFSLSNIDYGTNCSGIVVTKDSYNCSVNNDGPSSLGGDFSNVSGSCSLQYLDVANSLRFDSIRSTYLKRTASNGPNNTTATLNLWLKRSKLGTFQLLYIRYPTTQQYTELYFTTDNKLTFDVTPNSGTDSVILSGKTNNTFSDVSSWYNIVFIVDTTQSNSNDYVQIYVNGVKQSITYSIKTATPSQTISMAVSGTEELGRNFNGWYYDGYMSEIIFVGGQALGPENFGVSIGGKWLPKKYEGTYGTNGFHLDFSNSGNLGDDVAGTNDWNLVNYSTPANDQMIDTPTNNFATLNPVSNTTTYYNGNLSVSSSISNGHNTIGNIGIGKGKYYWEVKVDSIINGSYPNSATYLGVSKYPISTSSDIWGYYGYNGYKTNAGVGVGYGLTYSTNDIVGVSIDMDLGKLWFSKNGLWQSSSDNSFINSVPAYSNLLGSNIYPLLQDSSSTDGVVYTTNFGQGGQSGLSWCSGAGGYFKYCPPAGFKALSSKNIGN